MPILSRPLIGLNNNEEHYKTLVKRQTKENKGHNSFRNYDLTPMESTVVVH